MTMTPVNYDLLNQRERREIREHYVAEQNGECCHCHYFLDNDPAPSIMAVEINTRLFPHGFLSRPIHLHHNHKTGMTIGAVHARCNAFLWQYLGE